MEPIEKIIILKGPPQEETNLETEHSLLYISIELWALSSTGIGRVMLSTLIIMKILTIFCF